MKRALAAKAKPGSFCLCHALSNMHAARLKSTSTVTVVANPYVDKHLCVFVTKGICRAGNQQLFRILLSRNNRDEMNTYINQDKQDHMLVLILEVTWYGTF